MIRRRSLACLASIPLFLAGAAFAACGSSDDNTGSSGGTSPESGVPGSDANSGADSSMPGVDSSMPGAKPITGTVYDPSGTFPLPNVTVFEATAALPAIDPGVGSCSPKITAPGATTSGPSGEFMLTPSVSSGTVKVVAQIGKWRTTMNVVLTGTGASGVKLVLPKSAAMGNVPKIALSTGLGDSIECSMHRLGLDGVVTLFHGAGGANVSAPPSDTMLWNDAPTLKQYDLVLLACEANEVANANPTALSLYLDAGGFVFAEHYGYSWFNVAPFVSMPIATWVPGSNKLTGTTSATFDPSQSALKAWLGLPTVAALSPNGELPLTLAAPTNDATLSVADTATKLAISANASASTPNAPLYFSWDTPIGTASPVGRAVFAGFHLGTTAGDYGTTPGTTQVPANSVSPGGCAAAPISPAEKVFVYTLFESLSCGR